MEYQRLQPASGPRPGWRTGAAGSSGAVPPVHSGASAARLRPAGGGQRRLRRGPGVYRRARPAGPGRGNGGMQRGALGREDEHSPPASSRCAVRQRAVARHVRVSATWAVRACVLVCVRSRARWGPAAVVMVWCAQGEEFRLRRVAPAGHCASQRFEPGTSASRCVQADRPARSRVLSASWFRADLISPCPAARSTTTSRRQTPRATSGAAQTSAAAPISLGCTGAWRLRVHACRTPCRTCPVDWEMLAASGKLRPSSGAPASRGILAAPVGPPILPARAVRIGSRAPSARRS